MVRLEKVTGFNVWDLIDLKVSETQRGFCAANDVSIIEAYVAITSGAAAFPFGIYVEDTPVGFLMIGYGVDGSWTDAPRIAEQNYSIWRLMIDERYQGRGYGTCALRLALDFIRGEPLGPAQYCWLSYEPNNVVARDLYRSFGFAETGEMDEGEVIAVLPLSSGAKEEEWDRNGRLPTESAL